MAFLKLKYCLACGSRDLRNILNLNDQPLANSYLSSRKAKETKYELKVNTCYKFFFVSGSQSKAGTGDEWGERETEKKKRGNWRESERNRRAEGKNKDDWSTKVPRIGQGRALHTDSDRRKTASLAHSRFPCRIASACSHLSTWQSPSTFSILY